MNRSKRNGAHTVTKKIKAAAELIGILFCDHIIIGKEEYYSFHEAGEL